MIRVLVVGHSYVVGINQAKLAAIARTDRVRVGLLVPSFWKSAELGLEFPLERPFPDIPVWSGPVPFAGRAGAYFYPPHLLYRAFARFRPHLVHVEQECFSLSAFQLALCSLLARVPLSLFCWRDLDRPLGPPRRWTRRLVLRRAALMVAGNRDAAALLRRWGYRGRLAVSPQFGVDKVLSGLPPSSPHGNCLTVGFAGRLVPEKGVDVLLQALARVRGRGLPLRAVIVGGGPEEPALRALAHALGLGDAVDWVGPVRPEEVAAHMGRLDVLVLPSRTVPTRKEQFGRVLIEAMALGVAVVGSSSGAIPEVIGRPDLIFPEGDAEALAGLLERLATDPAWRAEVRAYGLDRVRENFTMEAVARKLVSLWEEVLEAPEGG